jgi:hypothetical protein
MNTIYPPSEIQEIFAPLMQEFYAVKNPRTGKAIRLSPTGHTYLYFRDALGNDFCYTPHPDQDGWYYSFAYIAVGKGSRTGKAKNWTMKFLQCHRKRKAAKARALSLKDKRNKT